MTGGSGGDCRGLPGGADKSRSGEGGGRGGRTAVVITAGTDGARAVPGPAAQLCNPRNICDNAIR